MLAIRRYLKLYKIKYQCGMLFYYSTVQYSTVQYSTVQYSNRVAPTPTPYNRIDTDDGLRDLSALQRMYISL